MIHASAPGKIMLAGEYAILWGHPAIVAALDRRARATVGAETAPRSPFLDEVRRLLAERFGVDAPAAQAARRVTVDTSAFVRRGRKLGIGSSAATTVCAIAAALGPDTPPELVHELAHAVHGAVQAPRGSRGSGADIVACVYGGVRAVRVTDDPEGVPRLPAHRALAWPSGLPFVLLWTHTPADTPALVGRVRAFAIDAPEAHATVIEAIGDVATRLERLLADANAPAPASVIQTIDDGAHALAALGEAAGVLLVPPGFAALAELARGHGGAVKPTGAGGGDLLLAVLPEAAAVAPFLSGATRLGLAPVSASIDPRGLRVAAHAASV